MSDFDSSTAPTEPTASENTGATPTSSVVADLRSIHDDTFTLGNHIENHDLGSAHPFLADLRKKLISVIQCIDPSYGREETEAAGTPTAPLATEPAADTEPTAPTEPTES